MGRRGEAAVMCTLGDSQMTARLKPNTNARPLTGRSTLARGQAGRPLTLVMAIEVSW